MITAPKSIKPFVSFLLEKIVLNQDDAAVFDFDDTLAVTHDLVDVTRAKSGKGDPDFSVDDLKKMGVNPKDIKGSFKIEDGPLAGSQAHKVTSGGYRDYGNGAKKLGHKVEFMDDYKPNESADEVYVGSFTPSGTVGGGKQGKFKGVDPIPSVIRLAKHAQDKGADVGIITARKGTKNIRGLDGKEQGSSNKKDIIDFMKKHGVDLDPENVFGAADFGYPPAVKADKIKSRFIKDLKPRNVLFFDDDDKNTSTVANAVKDPATRDIDSDGEPDVDVMTFNSNFHKSGIPSTPTTSTNDVDKKKDDDVKDKKSEKKDTKSENIDKTLQRWRILAGI